MSENEKRNAGAQQRQRNNEIHQDRNSVIKKEHAAFDNIGLTKRNADYMFRFNQALQATKLTPEKKAEIVQSTVTEIKAAQKTGKTARNLYGNDVDAHVKEIVEGPKRPADADDPYWPSALYNGLTFFTIFSLMFGIMYLISPQTQKGSQPVGLTAILLSAVIAGLALPAIPRMFDSKREHKYSLWVRIPLVLLFMVVWLLLFYLMAYLPFYLNPVLTAWPQIILGLLSGLGSWYVKRQFDLRQGFFTTGNNRSRK
ncbi:DUF1129 domain-containing protein [Secundilactobacillus folii]|uniref:DUF1129 family protein n=1 Tax=Secundilactobacillus folii TaxID=2678357 RepID=A0A7X2XWI5_9LACO|nr:DUF1129 domain-containing protein [Secundilactobacillus folii]MTV82228.1 DUF1129 family protein [Secundilactobacillus folii]